MMSLETLILIFYGAGSSNKKVSQISIKLSNLTRWPTPNLTT